MCGVPQNVQRRPSDPGSQLGQETQRQQQQHKPFTGPLVLPPSMQPQLSPLENSGGLPWIDPFFSAGQQGASREPQVMIEQQQPVFVWASGTCGVSVIIIIIWPRNTISRDIISTRDIVQQWDSHVSISESPSLAPQPHQRGLTPDYQPLFSIAGGSYMNQPSPDPSANLHSTVAQVL
ncbi:uncharacterized protein EDB91DRAFT_1078635 [Suillus paluster]|uniref:uncharacterized protein n=1 Tax=Suillus paluster TaxID=48578 RepID=UPI001B87A6E2|nr:uncharacterized protein EDB91DRAFT_1078635 [Suillus paluster]KAG1750629.1 hypothetical protein EDB91DRAFT_1078635 [Suillus paluster]